MPQSTLKRQPRLTPSHVRSWTGSGRRTGRLNLHVCFQVEQGYMVSAAYVQLDSQAVEALDLPKPTCFRSRSHSYLRAIQAGCSQDDDTGSVDSDETPPTTMSISSYSNSEYSMPLQRSYKPNIAIHAHDYIKHYIKLFQFHF